MTEHNNPGKKKRQNPPQKSDGRVNRDSKPYPEDVDDDIFASSEATHLVSPGTYLPTTIVELGDEISAVSRESTVVGSVENPTLIAEIDMSDLSKSGTKRSPDVDKSAVGQERTELLSAIDENIDDVGGAESRETSRREQPFTEEKTQLFKEDQPVSGMSDPTDSFVEESVDERTAFFGVPSLQARPKIVSKQIESNNELVDPTPRMLQGRPINGGDSSTLQGRAPLQARRSTSDKRQNANNLKGPDPLPNPEQDSRSRSKNSKGAQQRASLGRSSRDHEVRRSQRKMQSRQEAKDAREGPPNHGRERKPEARKSLKDKPKLPAKPQPLHTGIFVGDDDSSGGDVLGKVVDRSWKRIAAQDQEARHLDAAPSRTKYLWGTSILALLTLFAVGFLISSMTEAEKEQPKTIINGARLSVDQRVSDLEIRLPEMSHARRLSPGRDIFLVGSLGTFLELGASKSGEWVHADGLQKMLRSGNLKGALAHLEVVDSWPQELSVGLNGSLMLRTVETLHTALKRLGVLRLNALVESISLKSIGEIAVSFESTISSVPSVGALHVKVDDSSVSLSLMKSRKDRGASTSISLDVPRYVDLIDEELESFSFENPRVSRAFIEVHHPMSLGRLLRYLSPLTKDERMRLLTVVLEIYLVVRNSVKVVSQARIVVAIK